MSVRMGSEVEEPSKGRLGASFFLDLGIIVTHGGGKGYGTAFSVEAGFRLGRPRSAAPTLGATAFYLEYFSELMNQTA